MLIAVRRTDLVIFPSCLPFSGTATLALKQINNYVEDRKGICDIAKGVAAEAIPVLCQVNAIRCAVIGAYRRNAVCGNEFVPNN